MATKSGKAFRRAEAERKAQETFDTKVAEAIRVESEPDRKARLAKIGVKVLN